MLLDFDCSNKADGPYSLGCSHKFVMCSNGKAIFLSCAAGLVFDQLSAKCLEKVVKYLLNTQFKTKLL